MLDAYRADCFCHPVGVRLLGAYIVGGFKCGASLWVECTPLPLFCPPPSEEEFFRNQRVIFILSRKSLGESTLAASGGKSFLLRVIT